MVRKTKSMTARKMRNTIRIGVSMTISATRCKRQHTKAIGQPSNCYTQNTLLDVPRRATEAEDNELLKTLGRMVLKIAAEGDDKVGAERDTHIHHKLEQLERSLQ